MKLRAFVNAIPACVEAGVLKFTVWKQSFEVDLGIPALRFPLQCNMYSAENVAAYLRTEKYELYLYYEGIGEVVLRDSKLLCLLFRYKPWDCTGFLDIPFGRVMLPGSTVKHMTDAFLNRSTGDMVVSSEHSGLSVRLNLAGTNSFLLGLATGGVIQGNCFNLLMQRDGIYYANINWKPLQKIECEYVYQKKYEIF